MQAILGWRGWPSHLILELASPISYPFSLSVSLFSFPKAGGIGAWYPVYLWTGEESEWMLPLSRPFGRTVLLCFYQITESVSLNEADSLRTPPSPCPRPRFVSSFGNAHYPDKFNCKINCAHHTVGNFYLTTVLMFLNWLDTAFSSCSTNWEKIHFHCSEKWSEVCCSFSNAS